MDIKIILSTNENYAGPTAVAIKSVIDNCNKKNTYYFFILHSGLNADLQNKYLAMQTDNVEITCVDITDMAGKVSGLKYGHLTSETLFRLFIPELFPDDEKILYMDGDMVALDDIGKLYDIDLTNYVVAAAPDTGAYETVKHYESFMKSQPEENFNAGLLLINIPLFRELRIKEKCIELLLTDDESAERKLTYMDQDALNIVCQGKVRLFDMAWNVQPLVRDQEMECTMITPLCRKQYESAMESPKLIHYTGRQKPWLYPGALFADKFWEYEKQVDFHDEIVKVYEGELNKLGSRYPYWNIERGRNIVIYGAGYQGRILKRLLKRSGYACVVMMVDANYDGLNVKSVAEISDIEFDQIIIAVENENAVNEIYQNLVKKGVPDKKIVWLFERKCPWK